MVVICCRPSRKRRSKVPSSTRSKFGITLSRQFVVWRLSTIWESSIETSNVLTYFWQRMVWSSLATSMSQKCKKKDCYKLKPVPLTTHLLKSGRTSPMITNQTSGLLDVFCMRWSHWCLHSEHPAWLDSAQRYKEVSTIAFPANSQLTLLKWSRVLCSYHPTPDQLVIKF